MRPSTLFLIPLLALLIVVGAGCPKTRAEEPDRIRFDAFASGDSQAGMYGQVLGKPFRATVEGPHRRGALGGEGGREPIENIDVTFEVERPENGALFVENKQPLITVKADASGTAPALLQLGNEPGDVGVIASVNTPAGKKSIRFRAIAGVEKTRTDLEGPTGTTLEDVGIVLYDPPGKPAQGVTVYFQVESDKNNASVKPERVVTDSEGRALTSWTIGDKSRQYHLTAEIQDERPGIPPEKRFSGRQIGFTAMGVNKTAMTINLLGGLAIFIFGMTLMSGGLQRMADRRLKSILHAMTRNRLLAVAVGAIFTGLIQASGATTVMVVGFVNAGLMTLAQAVGVIFGANIGTTVTAQIIAFRLESLSYPAIALGLLVSIVAKKPAIRSLGEAILGFGLLFLGMTTMGDLLKPLSNSPEFRSYFQLFDCTPVNGMMPWASALMCIFIGTIMTVVIQSSSATVGLVMALASQGLINFYTAVPLVLGDNIGTTVTAILASLTANRNAKRAALAHTMFNVAGSAYMYALFFLPVWNGQPIFLGLVDALTPGNVFAPAPENIARHIANAHSLFNITNCILFLPLIGLMIKLIETIIPRSTADKETVLEYLEPHLLRTPALALEQAIHEVAYMVRRAQKSFEEGCAYFHGGPPDLERKVKEREKVIDRLQSEITAYLVELSRQELSAAEASLIPALIHAVNDIERIGDHSEELVSLGADRRQRELKFSEAADRDFRQLEQIVAEEFDASHRALVEKSHGQVERVLRRQGRITEIMNRISENHVLRLECDECDIQTGIIFLDFIGHMERIAHHLLNVAERAGMVIRTLEE